MHTAVIWTWENNRWHRPSMQYATFWDWLIGWWWMDDRNKPIGKFWYTLLFNLYACMYSFVTNSFTKQPFVSLLEIKNERLFCLPSWRKLFFTGKSCSSFLKCENLCSRARTHYSKPWVVWETCIRYDYKIFFFAKWNIFLIGIALDKRTNVYMLNNIENVYDKQTN